MKKTLTLKCNNVSYRYTKSRLVLKDININLNAGDTYGLIGPNGAGKTTLINILLGNMTPFKGDVSIYEHHIIKGRKIAYYCGYVPESINIPGYITGYDYLSLMQGIESPLDETKLEYLSNCLFFTEIHQRIADYSKGAQKKLLIINALLGKPSFLFFDEPTDGLDPDSRKNFKDLIHEQRLNNVTILLSSHVLDEVRDTCNKIGIMQNGQLTHTIENDGFNKNISDIYFRLKKG
ncbi:MAG: hypothetical protein CR997_00510 [Acidobacteria bacterium]|nr:MAG: hypothetical protein CR997_00510 [Acidobacteriota bacterium]